MESIYTKLNKKEHFAPVHVLLYTLPGIPSIYYGSEFAIEGRKERGSDASLRPALNLSDFTSSYGENEATKLICRLGEIRQQTKVLSYGAYRELVLTNRQYAFAREKDGEVAIVTVNNDDKEAALRVPCGRDGKFKGAVSGKEAAAENGALCVNIEANSGEIWLPEA